MKRVVFHQRGVYRRDLSVALKNCFKNINDFIFQIYTKWQIQWTKLHEHPEVSIHKMRLVLEKYYPDIYIGKELKEFVSLCDISKEPFEEIKTLDQCHFYRETKSIIFNIGMGGGKTTQTIDYLRKETILDLMFRTKEEGKELWLVGEDKGNYLQQVLFEPHVKYFSPTWSVENFIHKCEETAGIQLGRTTIEGWMCGKPSWIYKVDSGGFILSKERFEPPTDIEKFFASNVGKQIKEEYQKVL